MGGRSLSRGWEAWVSGSWVVADMVPVTVPVMVSCKY